jgi:hypothetical protein
MGLGSLVVVVGRLLVTSNLEFAEVGVGGYG